MSAKPKIELYDTTLRDGSQGEGISYSAQDKLRIAEKLDGFGMRFIEGGWPGSNPKDVDFFKAVHKLRLKQADVVAFGSTRRAHSQPSNDPNLKALIAAKTRYITIFGKSWDLHVRDVFKTNLDENLRMIDDSIRFLKSKGKHVIYDAEHFFDGYKSNPDYAFKTCLAALEAGAETIVLCDTNGGTMPSQVFDIVSRLKQVVHIPIGIHTHNDCSMAVANAVSAVQAGATHVQGTINGCGERCGNADLVSIIPNLQLKLGYPCLRTDHLKRLTEISRFVGEIGNMVLYDNQPYVGKSAFSHKGGVHINAVLKNPKTYEHIMPNEVGNHRRFLASELMGKTNVLLKAKDLNVHLTKDSPKTAKILTRLQKLENEGYQFEAAEASLELLIYKAVKQHKKFFDLLDFNVSVVSQEDGQILSEATIRLMVKGVEEHTAARGDGPVNALDNALRKALSPFYPAVKNMHLSDFKVRVLDQKHGTAAKVRVFITSQDERGLWTTVGISENIIEASWQALVDSIEYKLMRANTKGRAS